MGFGKNLGVILGLLLTILGQGQAQIHAPCIEPSLADPFNGYDERMTLTMLNNLFLYRTVHIGKKEKDRIKSAVLNAIKYGADPNGFGKQGRNIFYLGVYYNQDYLIKSLVWCGVDPNARTKSGALPIHFAIEQKRFKYADELIKNGARLNLPDSGGKSAFELAIKQGEGFLRERHEPLYYLLKKSSAEIDINIKNEKNGDTPIIAAAKSCDTFSIQLLKMCGGDPSIENKDGKNAFHYAQSIRDKYQGKFDYWTKWRPDQNHDFFLPKIKKCDDALKALHLDSANFSNLKKYFCPLRS